MSFLELRNVSHLYNEQVVLSDINFHQRQFQKIAIAGETGSGKSSLLKIIAGLLQPNSGEVFFEEKQVPGPNEKLVAGHPDIHYLSQHFELQKFLRVEQILTYANTIDDEQAQKLFEICHISHLMHRRSDELSGGEKQRIAIAKILISSPKLLLLDEPYSNLDMVHRNILRSVIHNISNKLNISCILISHDPEDTLPWADRLLVMRDGKIIQNAKPQKIYFQPVDEYVAGLFGNYNLLPPSRAKQIFGKVDFVASGSSCMIRPEQVQISLKGKTSAKAMVKRCEFAGSHFNITLRIDDVSLLVTSAKGDHKRGDEVFISLRNSILWCL
jgi:ABC-type sulfate/molybdate transport systems ATPase subunit